MHHSQEPKKARTLAVGIFLLALALGLLFSRSWPETYDSAVMLNVAQNMVDAGSFKVDPVVDTLGFNSPYSSYGIGVSALMAVGYAAAKAAGVDPFSVAMDVNAVLFALTMISTFWFARVAGASTRQSLACTTLVAFGTGLLPYTATGFSEPGVALAICLGLVAIQAISQERPWAPALAGIAAGAALLFRTDSLVLVVPFLVIGALWAARRKARAGLHMLVAFTPLVIIWAAYNDHRFGSPWRLGYDDRSFTHPFWKGVYGLLLSPGRGLFLYVPMAALVLAFMVSTWRRWPVITTVAFGLLIARVAFYASWWAWNGGLNWGPRLLVPAMPIFLIGFVVLVRRFPTMGAAPQVVIVMLFLLSAAVQVIGAATRYEKSQLSTEMKTAEWWRGSKFDRPENLRVVDSYLFDWSLFPITEQAGALVKGDELTGKLLMNRDFVVWRLVTVLSLAGLGSALIVLSQRRSEPRSVNVHTA